MMDCMVKFLTLPWIISNLIYQLQIPLQYLEQEQDGLSHVVLLTAPGIAAEGAFANAPTQVKPGSRSL